MTDKERIKMLQYAALIEEHKGDLNFLTPGQRKEIADLLEKHELDEIEEEKLRHAS